MKGIKEFFKRNAATLVNGGVTVFMYAREAHDGSPDEDIEYMASYDVQDKTIAVKARTLVREPWGSCYYNDGELWSVEVPAGTSTYNFLKRKLVGQLGWDKV